MPKFEWLCEDWECPARVSCARHFGRSKAYAAMNDKHPPLQLGARPVDAESCMFYELDSPRPWLLTAGDPAFVHAGISL